MSVCLFVCSYVGLSVCMSICMYVCMSVCLSVCLSTSMYDNVYASLSACLPVCLSVFLFALIIYTEQMLQSKTQYSRHNNPARSEALGVSYFIRTYQLTFPLTPQPSIFMSVPQHSMFCPSVCLFCLCVCQSLFVCLSARLSVCLPAHQHRKTQTTQV